MTEGRSFDIGGGYKVGHPVACVFELTHRESSDGVVGYPCEAVASDQTRADA